MKKVLIKILQAKPSMYLRSELGNLLGAQFLFSFILYLHRIIRIPSRKKEAFKPLLKTLNEDGVVVLENFFSAEEHALIEKSYRSLESQFVTQQSPVPLPHVSALSIHNPQIDERVKKLFIGNPFFDEFATAFLNRKYHFPIQGFFMRIFCDQDEGKLPQNGGTNNIHFDVPARTLKYFYYIADTNEQNAAFTYYKGSQKRTIKRALFEYKKSVEYTRNKHNPNHGGEYRDGEPWVKITDEEMQRLGFKESFISGKANSLVIANVGGFHRRGAFPKAGVRETVEINYRSIEMLRNDLYPIEMFFRKIFNKPLAHQVDTSEY